MEQLTAPLQRLLDAVTGFFAQEPAAGMWYMAFVRFLFPALAVLILYRALRSLLKVPHTPETWGQLSLPNGTSIPLTHWENILGRGKTADVYLNYPSISRQHAALCRGEDAQWTVYDLGSRGGTAVNGTPVEGSAPLKLGDTLSLGGVPLVFLPQTVAERAAGTEASVAVPLTFLGLTAVMWGYFGALRAFRCVGFELETIAFFLSTLSLAVTASSAPGSLYKQFAAIVLGLGLFVVLGLFLRDLSRVQKYRWLMAAAAIGLLGVTLLIGKSKYGAVNWISIGPLSFQPSEIAKICYIFAGSATLERLFRRRNLSLFIVLTGVCIGCLGLMSDFGTAAIFFVTFLVIAYLRSGDFATLALICGGAVFGAGIIVQFKPYILSRFASWGHAWEAASTTGYQQTRTMSGPAAGRSRWRISLPGERRQLMKKIERRAVLCRILALLLAAGLAVFLVKYFTQGGSWASSAFNRHLYNTDGVLSSGTVLDRDGDVLTTVENGRRTYYDNETVRKATLHAVGDLQGNIGTGALNAFADRLTGYDLVNGAFGAVRGSQLYLTVDARYNYEAYQALAGRAGTVAVYNYRTGEILCMVSSPSYDPLHVPADILTNERYQGAYLNRFLSSCFTPGSIYKTVTLAAALEELPDLEERTWTCSGSVQLGDETIICSGTHGAQHIGDAFANSCNVAFAQIAEELGAETLLRYTERAGLTDSYSVSGLPTAKGSFQWEGVTAGQLGWAGVGQYNDQVNPCAMMVYMGAIAGGGCAAEPYLIQKTVGALGLPSLPHLPRRTGTLVSRDTAETLADMMAENVVRTYGAERFPGMDLCAKSGTAEVGQGKKPHAWFTGFLRDPETPYAFVVLVENGGGGSSVAGSVAARGFRGCPGAGCHGKRILKKPLCTTSTQRFFLPDSGSCGLRGQAAPEMAHGKEDADEMGGAGKEPGDGIGPVNSLDGVIGGDLEHRGDPDQPQAAGTDQCDHHGQDGVADAPQRSHGHVHYAADGIGETYDVQPLHSAGNDCGRVGVKLQQLRAEKHHSAAQKDADSNDAALGQRQHPPDAAVVPGAQILAGEGDVGLVEGIHSHIDEIFQAGGGGAAGHHDLTKGVDGALDHHVGKGEQNALESGRQSHTQDLAELDRVDLQLAQVQADGTAFPHETADHQKCGDALGDDRCQRHTGHIHVEHNDKQEIQHHIDGAGGREIVQRPAGVADCPQQSGAEVIEHGGGHPQKVDAQIQGRELEDLRRRLHPGEELPGAGHTGHGQDQPAEDAQKHGGVYGFAELSVLPGAEVTGSQDVGADRQPQKQIGQQIDQ